MSFSFLPHSILMYKQSHSHAALPKIRSTIELGGSIPSDWDIISQLSGQEQEHSPVPVPDPQRAPHSLGHGVGLLLLNSLTLHQDSEHFISYKQKGSI